MTTFIAKGNKLFSGPWLRWRSLTQTEQVICACVVLNPIWWLIGISYSYIFVALVASIITHHILQRRELRLKNPSLVVITAMAFGLYGYFSLFFYFNGNTAALGPSTTLELLGTWLCPGFIIWYIQSHDIRVRPQVVAWAFSISVVQILLFWCVIYLVWHQGSYAPSRSLMGILTGKSTVYVPGVGNSNYLTPYFPGGGFLPGLARYVFFFPGPEAFALTAGFVALLALDLKNRFWSIGLFCTSILLIFLSGTRSSWLALPCALGLRYLLTSGKALGPSFICTLIALVSFVTLSIPPVTYLVTDITTNTAAATGGIRADSTEVRGEIYKRTREAIIKAPDNFFYFGHVVTGETVLPGYAPAMIGSHSFILGTLLYRSGLVGTGIFATYWASLILWFYQTRRGRPMCCLLVFLFFSLAFSVMEFESVVMPITLICLALREPALKHVFKG